jgi:hypothetical protein
MTRQRIDAMLRAWSWRDGGEAVDVSTEPSLDSLRNQLLRLGWPAA